MVVSVHAVRNWIRAYMLLEVSITTQGSHTPKYSSTSRGGQNYLLKLALVGDHGSCV